MKVEQGYFDHKNLGSIYFQNFIPENAAKAVIILVHGSGEHSSRYEHVAALLTANNFAVVTFDLPGHGRSDGAPGFIRSFDDYLAALRSFHSRVQDEFQELPKILLGHSMGGLICANYLLEKQQAFIGCALSGPAIKTELQPGFFKVLLIKFLALVAPKLGVLKLDSKGVSRDPVVVKNYNDDPLVFHGKITARKLYALFIGMKQIEISAKKITLPILLMHGDDDLMTAPGGSIFLHNQVQSESNTLKIYPGLYHEIFNEPEQDEVLADLLGWMEELLN